MTSFYLDAAAAIERACFNEPWDKSSLRGELSGAGAYFYIALDGAAPAGYCGFRAVAGEGELLRLAVLPEARRKGLGGELLDAALERVRALGLERLHLEVRASNLPALALYESRGFAHVGLRRGYYKNPADDAVLMTYEIFHD